jgi:hypothetical protein
MANWPGSGEEFLSDDQSVGAELDHVEQRLNQLGTDGNETDIPDDELAQDVEGTLNQIEDAYE